MPPETEATKELLAKWGDTLTSGWTAIPNLLLKKQSELNISAIELNVILNLVRFWWEPSRAPFPSAEKMGQEMGVSTRTVYRTLAALEEKGLLDSVRREGEATRYELHGLVEKLGGTQSAM